MSNRKSSLCEVLKIAEVIDAFRIVPRVIIAMYAYGLYFIIKWYIDFELQYITKCDSATLNVLLKEGVPLEQATNIACTVSDVIGHPTGYTALVATMVGAAAVVFGLYARSGRSWEGNNSMSKHHYDVPPSGPTPPKGF